jgi:hypothetical protein
MYRLKGKAPIVRLTVLADVALACTSAQGGRQPGIRRCGRLPMPQRQLPSFGSEAEKRILIRNDAEHLQTRLVRSGARPTI